MSDITDIEYEGPKDMIVHDDGQFANLLDTAKFNHLWRVAKVFANSQMVPDHYQGNPANCFVALQMSFRLGIDPMMFMQKSYILKGKPGVEAQLKIGLTNSFGPFTGRIQWEYDRDEKTGIARSCTAIATLKENGDTCRFTVTWDTVEKNKWAYKWEKNDRGDRGRFIEDPGSKWNTMRDKMFAYRSASWLIDLYCPEVVLGLPTIEELRETEDVIDVTPVKPKQIVTAEKPFDVLFEEFLDVIPAPDKTIDGAELQVFIEKTAKANNMTQEALLGEAIKQLDEFWRAFETWSSPKDGEVVDAEFEPEESLESARKELKTLCDEAGMKPPAGYTKWDIGKLTKAVAEMNQAKARIQHQEDPPPPEPPEENTDNQRPLGGIGWLPDDATREKIDIILEGYDYTVDEFNKAANHFANVRGLDEKKLTAHVFVMAAANPMEQNGMLTEIMDSLPK